MHRTFVRRVGMDLHLLWRCLVMMLGLWGAQWAKTGRFQLYNYGSAATNSHVYKKPEPPDIAEGYHLLDIPLDVVAGKRLSFAPSPCVHWLPCIA